MEKIFRLEAIEEIYIQNFEKNRHIKDDEFEIYFDINSNNILKKIDFIFETEDEFESFEKIDLYNKVLKKASQISDAIFIATEIYGFNPKNIIEIQRITKDNNEIETICTKKYRGILNNIVDSNLKCFNLDELEKHKKHPIANEYYVNAFKTNSIILKYQEFYKVIEYFFKDKDSDKLDRAVSNYCKQIDSTCLKKNDMKNFRQLRNRCTHPDNKKHIHPGNLEGMNELVETLPKIKKLAKFLIDNPTF